MDRYDNITSPVNGVVVAIEQIGHKKYKIFIKVSKTNLKFYAPINGYINIKEYQKGLNLNPLSIKGMLLNTKIRFFIDELEIEIFSGLCSPEVSINDKYVRKNEDIGLLLDGLVIIYLNRKPQVELNMAVEAKQTIL